MFYDETDHHSPFRTRSRRCHNESLANVESLIIAIIVGRQANYQNRWRSRLLYHGIYTRYPNIPITPSSTIV